MVKGRYGWRSNGDALNAEDAGRKEGED